MTEVDIDALLKKDNFSSQSEVKQFVSEVQIFIREYEQELYENDNYNDEEKRKVKNWRLKLYKILQQNKTLKEVQNDHEELEKTAKVVHRQIRKADINQGILDKSTLKLIGLNYTNSDIQNVLKETKNKIKENKEKERKENYFLIASFIFFIIVCLLILFEKYVSG